MNHRRPFVAVVAVVVVVAVMLVLMRPPTFLSLALVVIAIGAIAMAIWSISGSTIRAPSTLQHTSTRLLEFNELELRQLRDELDRLEDPRPAYQLQAVAEKRDNLVAILGHRMEVGELTYARYQSSAQQVYQAVVRNLREVSIATQSVSTIDPDYIDARLAALVDKGDQSAIEISSLQDRRALAASQRAKISHLLAQNESAMTLLDRTSTALADAPIGLSPRDAEASILALRELADRAGKYATDRFASS